MKSRSHREAALAGHGEEAQVVAEHVAGDYAAVCLSSRPEHGPWVVVLQRTDGEWLMRAEGDGTLWVDNDDSDEERGVLAFVQRVREPGRYRLNVGTVEVVVDCRTRTLLAVLVGVRANDQPQVLGPVD